jgi:multiple sugar transport system substrate-binding protein
MRGHHPRRFAAVLGVGLGALLLLAGPGAAARKPPIAKARPVTLDVWIMPNAMREDAEKLDELVRPFVEANPNVKVVPTVLDWGAAWGKIQAAVSGGPAPDLMQLGTTWVAAIAATGKLLDLTDKYDARLFPPQVLASTTIEGPADGPVRRYAMPWIVDTRALYYNKAACIKAGVDPKRDFATWTSFRTALKKLAGVEVDGKRLQAFGIPRAGWDVIHNLSWWIWGAGGGFVARRAGESGIDSEGTLAGLEYFFGLYHDGLVSPAADKGDANAAADLLRRGEIATTIAYPIPNLSEDRFGIALLPEGPKGRFTFLGGSTLAVLKSSKHPDEAVALVKFLSSEAAQVRYSTQTGLLPAAAAEYDELLLKLDPTRGAFVDQMRFGRAYPSIPQWGEIENVLRGGLGAAWDLGIRPGPFAKAAVRAELTKMAKAIDDIVRPPAKPNPI